MSTDASWRHTSATLCGESHERTGDRCQDSSASVDLPGGYVGLVVADGCGSDARSDEGSAVAVEVASALLPGLASAGVDAGWSSALSRLFAQVREAWIGRLGSAAASARTTLAVTVVGHDGLAFGTVGDAFTVVGRSDGTFAAVCPIAEKGDFVNETRFLGDDDGDHPSVHTIHDAEIGFACLSTDGLEMFLESRVVRGLDGQSSPQPWRPGRIFEHLDRVVRDQGFDVVVDVLASPGVRSRKGDDLGVAVAVR